MVITKTFNELFIICDSRFNSILVFHIYSTLWTLWSYCLAYTGLLTQNYFYYLICNLLCLEPPVHAPKMHERKASY